MEWSNAVGPLIGLAGVIVGGLVTGVVSSYVDRQRRDEARRLRHEEWKREDAIRERDNLNALLTRTFLKLNGGERWATVIAEYEESTWPWSRQDRTEASHAMILLRDELLDLRAEYDVLAPDKILLAFRDVVGAAIVAYHSEMKYDQEGHTESQRRASVDFLNARVMFRQAVRDYVRTDDSAGDRSDE